MRATVTGVKRPNHWNAGRRKVVSAGKNDRQRSGDGTDHAAVHAQRSAIDGRSEGAAAECHCHPDLLGRGEALDDGAGASVSEELALKSFSISALIFRQLVDELDNTFRGGRPGKHRVDGDRGSGGGFGEASRYGELRSLGHSIVDHLGWNLESGFARYENNAPPVFLPHGTDIVSA